MDLGDVYLVRILKFNVFLLLLSMSLRQEKIFFVVLLESERYYSVEEDNLENIIVVFVGSIDDSMLLIGS